jgi:hypothetical protein
MELGMRKLKLGLGLLTSVVAVAAWAAPTLATDLDRPRAPAGFNKTQDIHQWRYVPKYRHVYHVAGAADPYAYQVERRGYYPYYKSNYWVSAAAMRNRYHYTFPGQKYQYSQSWGKPRVEHGLPQPRNESDDLFRRKHW